MKRLAELETRRRALLSRCDAQRAEISWCLAQLSPRRWRDVLAGSAPAPDGSDTGAQRRHPLAWMVAAAALLLLRRPRAALSMLARARGALSIITRAAEVLSVVGVLRRARPR
ncbi:MAG: hypothetical protein JOZ34_11415 [Gammaproteobacteria bacterium]|nr:hypothetical protein [Gammaproteobacteria bacterium]